MSQIFFKRLMERVDRRAPDKVLLAQCFMQEARKLPLTVPEQTWLIITFDFSFDEHTHALAPMRASGEVYFFHPFRAALRAIWRQVRLGICDVQVIIDTLLHDCFEEAEDAGNDSRLTYNRTLRRFGAEVAYETLCVTKQKKVGETSEEYCKRLSQCDVWRSLVAKFEDRIDNIWTIGACSPEKRKRKIRETERWFPIFRTRLQFLIDREIDKGVLDPNWSRMPTVLYNYLFRVVRLQKRMYGIQ